MIRSLGHVHLCGVLHVAWQTKNGVDGRHMVTLLYRDCLVVAAVEKLEGVYSVGAIISFNDIRIEEADNGRGMCPRAYNNFTTDIATNYARHSMPYSTIFLENSVRV